MINIINKEYLQSRSYESDIIQHINKKEFFSELKRNGFNPENLLHIKKFSTIMIRKFNFSLRKTNKKSMIRMFEMILMLDEDYSTVDMIVSILDEKNKQIVRNECVQAYHINDDDCILFDILS